MKRYVLNKPLIDDYKRQSGRTDLDLALLVGAHPMSFSRWLNGRREVPVAVAMALESITGHSFRDLIVEAEDLAATGTEGRP